MLITNTLGYPRATKKKLHSHCLDKLLYFPARTTSTPGCQGFLFYAITWNLRQWLHPILWPQHQWHFPQSSQHEERQIRGPTCPCLPRTPVISTPRTLSRISHMAPDPSSTRKCTPLCACDRWVLPSMLSQATPEQSGVQSPRPLPFLGLTWCRVSRGVIWWPWVTCFLLRFSIFVNNCSFQGSLHLAWDHWH